MSRQTMSGSLSDSDVEMLSDGDDAQPYVIPFEDGGDCEDGPGGSPPDAEPFAVFRFQIV